MACGSGTKWNTQTSMCETINCQTNADCNQGGRSGYYCYLNSGKSCDSEFDSSKGYGKGGGNYTGQCLKVSANLTKKAEINGTTYYGSGRSMTWWSACRLCAANANADDSVCASPENDTALTFMAGYDMLQCADTINMPKSGSSGYCHETKVNHTREDCETVNNKEVCNISDVVGQLKTMFGGSYYLWLKNNWSSCYANSVRIDNGNVFNRDRSYSGYALCR